MTDRDRAARILVLLHLNPDEDALLTDVAAIVADAAVEERIAHKKTCEACPYRKQRSRK